MLISGIAVACIYKFIFVGENFITGNKEFYKTGVSKKPCPSFSDTASCERLPASSLCNANNVTSNRFANREKRDTQRWIIQGILWFLRISLSEISHKNKYLFINTTYACTSIDIYFSPFVLHLHVQMKLHLEYVIRHILKENIEWKTVISVQMPRNLTTLSGINDCWLMTKPYRPNHMYFENIPSSHIYKHLH